MESNILRYKDEKDRAYGLGGMLTCMYCLENEQFIDSVSLDYEADGGLRFVPSFFTSRNQKLSPKAVWADDMNHFRIKTGLMVSNVMSRRMVREMDEMSREINDALLAMLREEGSAQCGLDDDEVSDVFYRTYSFFHRVFCHREVAALMSEFVSVIEKERHLEKERIAELFRLLSRQ